MPMPKPKLKWFREGYDPHEDLYLIPVDQERTEDGDLETLLADCRLVWLAANDRVPVPRRYGHYEEARDR